MCVWVHRRPVGVSQLCRGQPALIKYHRIGGRNFHGGKRQQHLYILVKIRSKTFAGPLPHKTLRRRESALLRQIQTNVYPPYTSHRFQRTPGTPKCPHCGEYPNIYHTLWTCTQNPSLLPPIPNPTPTSWERRLADSSAARTGCTRGDGPVVYPGSSGLGVPCGNKVTFFFFCHIYSYLRTRSTNEILTQKSGHTASASPNINLRSTSKVATTVQASIRVDTAISVNACFTIRCNSGNVATFWTSRIHVKQ